MDRVVTVAIALEALLGVLPHLKVRRLSVMSVPWFVATWLTLELPLHHLAFSLALGVAGAIVRVPLWALALSLVACATHLANFLFAQRSVDVLVNALDGFLPKDRHDALSLALHQRRRAFRVWPYPFTPRAVRVVRDVPYGPLKKRNFLDVYVPRDQALPEGGSRPVLLQVHGGGWTISQKRHQARPLMHALTARGWVCVSINYRLSPWAKFPDHIVDVKRAIAWVKEHVHEFGGDPARIVITGGSAGGHLSSLAALTPNEAAFQPGFEGKDTSVAACVPLYGVYDFLDRHNDRRDQSIRALLRVVMRSSAQASRSLWEQASPLSWINEEAPPFFVIHGSDDCLAWVEEARRFVAELRKVSKKPVLFAELPRAQHAFEVFHSTRTELTVEAISAFVNEVAGGAPLVPKLASREQPS
jgi:acetyl esterase/lipase